MSSAKDALLAARQRLETAYFGLKDMRDHPERLDSGWMNAVVFGRMVTFSLQNMRSTVPEFDAWYEGVRAQMKQDQIMSFFWELRTIVEKKVGQATMKGVAVNFDTRRDRHLFGNPPPNAKGMFLGDAEGRSGWHVQMKDGSIEKYFVSLPQERVRRIAAFIDAPRDWKFERADNLIEAYLGKLSAILQDAEHRFGS